MTLFSATTYEYVRCFCKPVPRGLEILPDHPDCLYNFGLGMDTVSSGVVRSRSYRHIGAHISWGQGHLGWMFPSYNR